MDGRRDRNENAGRRYRQSTRQNVHRKKDVPEQVHANRPGEIAFASSFRGSIRAVKVTPDKTVVAQKGAFLASYGDIEVSVFFQKKIGAGFFGGEGFLMQKYSGNGIVFLEIDGSAIEYDIPAGDKKNCGHRLPRRDECFLLDGSGHGQGCEKHLPRRRGSIQHRGQRPRTHHILQTMPVQNTASLLYNYMPHPSNN